MSTGTLERALILPEGLILRTRLKLRGAAEAQLLETRQGLQVQCILPLGVAGELVQPEAQPMLPVGELVIYQLIR